MQKISPSAVMGNVNVMVIFTRCSVYIWIPLASLCRSDGA